MWSLAVSATPTATLLAMPEIVTAPAALVEVTEVTPVALARPRVAAAVAVKLMVSMLFRLAGVTLLVAAFIAVLWRPLKIATFDEGFAATLGLPVRLLSLGLIAIAAMACVAAFSAVGSILVIAMLICPPAAARLMTDRLERQVGLSLILAAVAANAGYVLAGYGPFWIGLTGSVSAAGMIAVVAGAMLALAAVFGRHRLRAT